MKKYLMIGMSILITTLVQPVVAQERPELGNAVYSYGSCSADPTTVHVLRIGSKANKEFLVQIVGVDHGLNGQVVVYKAKDLESSKLKFSLLNKKKDQVTSSLVFEGGDQSARLYIKGYVGLYTPSGALPDDISRRVCLIDTSLDPLQYYRRYENQQAVDKKKS